ncbi:hypothetical protein E3H11_08205 [Bradyrhizobium brasilense]|nr:hypothetical protein [Bradyrhizobium brasilense]
MQPFSNEEGQTWRRKQRHRRRSR